MEGAPPTTAAPPSGWHRESVNGLVLVLPDRYHLVRALGQGSYGLVYEAEVGSSRVAIKRVGCAGSFADAKRALRELLLLRHLQHENVLTLYDVFLPPPARSDLCLVCELMDADLALLIASDEALNEDHCAFFTYQILSGVQYLHSANVVHRDLKPSNLLINRDCDLRIADFGLARSLDAPLALPADEEDASAADVGQAVDEEVAGAADVGKTADEEVTRAADMGQKASAADPRLNVHSSGVMTQYVVTRPYRAPELLLLCSRYTHSVDLWSIGCILAELLTRKTLFPGRHFLDQLRRIVEACHPAGRPPHVVAYLSAPSLPRKVP